MNDYIVDIQKVIEYLLEKGYSEEVIFEIFQQGSRMPLSWFEKTGQQIADSANA